MRLFALRVAASLPCRVSRLRGGARSGLVLCGLAYVLPWVLLSGAPGCGARTALTTRAYRESDDATSSEGTSSAAPARPFDDAPASNASAGNTGNPAAPDDTRSGASAAPTFGADSPPEDATSGRDSPPPQAGSKYTLPFTVVGKPQSESALHHPLPSDGTLATTIAWLEEGEGLPYPLRYVEWTLVGERKGKLLAVGPASEIYTRPYSVESSLIERYTPGYGWAEEPIHVSPDGTHVAVTALSVGADGVAWAATSGGLFTRGAQGAWSPAPGLHAAGLDGVDFATSPSGVAYGVDGVFTTGGNGVWARVDRHLPLVSPNTAYGRGWLGFRASGGQLLGRSDVDVVWVGGSGANQAYPIRARDVGFGAAGERLVLGLQELLVPDAAEWRVYPIQVGGHRGGASLVDALAVSPLGDAYVSGMARALFHRFPDGSMEYLNTPGNSETVAASADLVVVRDDVGVWQATPRATAHTSGVFEAVVPRTYRASFTSPVEKVELPFTREPPPCFDVDRDVDLGDAVGDDLVFVTFEPRQRLRFRAPETGTFQFRVEWTTTSGNVATYPARVWLSAECEPAQQAQGNPLYVALEAGQYLLVEVTSQPTSTGGFEAPGGWLSIR